jgi:hypothetical protein
MWKIIYCDFDTPKGYAIADSEGNTFATLTNEIQALNVVRKHNESIKKIQESLKGLNETRELERED